MAIRTGEQYRESLRDGREVFILGEKVEDITKHRMLGICADTVAASYDLSNSKDPETRDLFTAQHPDTGEPINRFFVTPKNTEDLARRTKMIHRSMEIIGELPFGRDIGTD